MFFKKWRTKRHYKKWIKGSYPPKLIDYNSPKYKEFVRAGGAVSGLFDVSDKRTAEFVEKYREFIPANEICVPDKNGNLVPTYTIKNRNSRYRRRLKKL